ncbi:MAG TPA: hypothetical protein VHH73_11865, partial [Verrucomicrobiae bacterium]|nr:hypothetical protein [Verrucomicrobiae bacterium]
EARETLHWFRGQQVATLEQFLKRQKINLADLAKPPAPSDPSHTRYCPRCESQYTDAAEVCPECGGRALEKL